MTTFEEVKVMSKLKHYLPHQSPLKDFVHHNTLGAFQHLHFEKAIANASELFGYKTSLNIEEYRRLYKKHLIREDVLESVIIRRKGKEKADEWIHNLFHKNYKLSIHGRLGRLREQWQSYYKADFDREINPLLFKLLGGYLDQGIAQWHFPYDKNGFLASLRRMNRQTTANFVRTRKGRVLLNDRNVTIHKLLDMLVGDESLYENYLFDQQFSHPGWSGLVATVESHPETLMDKRPIVLADLVKFELILEIDTLEFHHKNSWKPLADLIEKKPVQLFAPVEQTEEHEVIAMWQEAYEWSYYDSVLAGIKKMHGVSHHKEHKTFQALFCIDDREGSIRRHIENFDPKCETYGTPGYFGIPMYYQPRHSEFHTKVCPGPVHPRHLVKELGETSKLRKNIHFSPYSVHPLLAWPYALTVGFWSGLMMFLNIFKPSFNAMATSSFSHMGKASRLSVEYVPGTPDENGLQVGFTIEEMGRIVMGVLKSIGLIADFGTLIYLFGHGASSINNTHYAGYDCGACSGRPGSVNARVFAIMANHPKVREWLKENGIHIPDSTQFIAGLHDTTRDEFEFYDEDILHPENQKLHEQNQLMFKKALDMNAKERSRRFFSANSRQPAHKVHEAVKNRSVSLFEPRPELNHATNALCIVGRHSLHEGLFLDRRAFSNSYDYSCDPEGNELVNILNAAVPVSGGINLEYYFSRVDNQKLGAGSKLPHNVVGLVSVMNGVEGDLRTGLPIQMVEVHDPIRLMMIVEHFPEVVLEVIQRNPATYEWFINEWVILAVADPETADIYRFEKGAFRPYHPLKRLLDTVEDVDTLIESHDKNLPVYLIKKN